jgi:hypothetical protein
MAKKPIEVTALKHDAATRRNIPTAEYESVMREEDKSPVQLAYERRNRDLDPQLVWRGKDEQDWSDLIVQAPPLYIQEKVHPKVIIVDLKREASRRAAAAVKIDCRSAVAEAARSNCCTGPLIVETFDGFSKWSSSSTGVSVAGAAIRPAKPASARRPCTPRVPGAGRASRGSTSRGGDGSACCIARRCHQPREPRARQLRAHLGGAAPRGPQASGGGVCGRALRSRGWSTCGIALALLARCAALLAHAVVARGALFVAVLAVSTVLPAPVSATPHRQTTKIGRSRRGQFGKVRYS